MSNGSNSYLLSTGARLQRRIPVEEQVTVAAI
jgi:hypothetical protein